MSIYSKITKFRNEHRDLEDYNIKRNFLEQLLLISFNNMDKPDSLPEVFEIDHIYFSKEDLIKFMAELGYNVEVETVWYEWNSKFYKFKVTLIK